MKSAQTSPVCGTLVAPRATLSAHDTRRVAVEASTDPRTVVRFVRGQKTQSTTAARIRAAIERLALAPGPMSERDAFKRVVRELLGGAP
jgi:hypothetical protein